MRPPSYVAGILLAVIVVVAAGASACDSGSSNPGNSPGFSSGVYLLKSEVANVTCSDGTVTRSGYGITGEIIENQGFLELKRGAKVVGRGHIEEGDIFHMSANLDEFGFPAVAILDGKLTATGVTGISQTGWTTDAGLECGQISEFSATLQDGQG
ncbi:MAG: hypothetical protein OEZ32_05485 [Nitrospinota bacterium]|nr:hypothetical protein [Nitrospinota bacterium]